MIALRFLLVLAVLAVAACKDSTPSTPRRIPSAVRLDQPALTLDDGASAQLNAVVFDQNNQAMPLPPGQTILWSSSDENIAAVDGMGRVTANRPGTAVIRASLGALFGEATVNVRQVATSLHLVTTQNLQGTVGAPLAQPVEARVLDRHGNGVAGATLSFTVVEGGGSASPGTATTSVEGRGQAVWTLGTAAGPQRLRIGAGGLAGSPAELHATARPGPPDTIQPGFGDQQSGTVGSLLLAPISVRVFDAHGNPVEGATVTWTPDPESGTVTPASSATDVSGTASTDWRLGTTAGTQRVVATVAGLPARSAVMTATARPEAVSRLTRLAGEGQSGSATQPLPSPLSVRLTDQFGNPVPGATVVWSPDPEDGTADPPVSSTDANGVASTVWRLGSTQQPHRLVATVAALSVIFTAAVAPAEASTVQKISGDGQSAPVASSLPTLLRVRVLDPFGIPVPDQVLAWRSVDGGSITGSARTDVGGYAQATAAVGTTAGIHRFQAEARPGVSAEFTATAVAERAITFSVAPEVVNLSRVGETQQLTATARDQYGNPASGSVSWVSGDRKIATVSSTGLVTAAGHGDTHVIGIYVFGNFSLRDTSLIRADLSATFERLEVTPPADTIDRVGGTSRLAAHIVDASGNRFVAQGVLWDVVSGPARVNQNGLVTSTGEGTAWVRARWGTSLADTAAILIRRVPAQVQILRASGSAGDTVVIGPGFGSRNVAQVVDTYGEPMPLPITWTIENTAVASIATSGTLGQIVNLSGTGTGSTRLIARSSSLADTAYVFSSHPLAFAPGSLSGEYTASIVDSRMCALRDSDRSAWCWEGRWAMAAPRKVRGGFAWSQVDAGGAFSCGITTGGETHCWGFAPDSLAPQPVPGAPTFVQVTVGRRSFACGRTADGTAYCWGDNAVGQLGTGDNLSSSTPRPVVGGHAFQHLEAGRDGICGITTTQRLLCWGRIGPYAGATTPAEPVSGTSFLEVGTGRDLCGVSTAGAAICSPTTHEPVANLIQLDGAHDYYCGIRAGGQAWCFPWNSDAPHRTGAPAAGQPVDTSLRFSVVAVGVETSCGIALSDQRAYCWGYFAYPTESQMTYRPLPVFPPYPEP